MTTTPPTNPTPEPIEQQLAQATQWTGGDTALWQRALEQVEREAKPARPSIIATLSRHARMAAMIGVASIAVIIAAVTTRHASQESTARVATATRSAATAPFDAPMYSYNEGAASSSADRGDMLAIRARRTGDVDVAFGRDAQYTDSSLNDKLDQSAPATAPGSAAQFDSFDLHNDRFAAVTTAESMRPGTTNALSQSFSAQHAELLPPPPEPDAAEVIRERAAAGAPAPVAATPIDDATALSKSASPERRVLDGETYALQRTREESAAKREQPTDPQPVAATPAPRAIVRTVNMQFGVEDVRSAFSSVESIVTAAPGSFIESSELRGEGRAASGSVVIRVPADNLDPLLASIRPLGKVLVETSTAQDVGEQLVDIQARMTNAERFERELLETLNRTSGAKPNEILEVQRAVADVRETIERLSAQSARLGSQIALSTIRISLTTEPDDPTPARAEGLSGYLGRQLHSAWRGGLVAVADSFAWLVSVIVGGALWWAILIIAALILRRWFKKRSH